MKKIFLVILTLCLLTLASCADIDVSNDNEKYEITFNNCGFGESTESVSDVLNLPLNLPILFEDGYKFDGWYLDENYTKLAKEGMTISSDITLYAKWKKLEYTSGLDFMISEDGSYYILFGINESAVDVVIPPSHEGVIVKEIGEGAFMSDEILESLIIPSTVEKINGYAFNNCKNLKSVSVGASLKEIDKYAFCGLSSLEELVVDPNNVNLDSRNNCNAVIETSTNTLLVGCKTTIIPDTVEIIGKYAFYGCSQLNNLVIPSSVVTILDMAFHSCSNLQTIVILGELEEVGLFAFVKCDLLKTIYNNSSLELVSGSDSYGKIAFNATTIYNKGEWEYINEVPTPKE